MTIEEKRKKDALRARNKYQKQKMDYENRFQLPEGSEKVSKIQESKEKISR